jgi:hypothetical protein
LVKGFIVKSARGAFWIYAMICMEYNPMNKTKTIITVVLLLILTLLPQAFAEERWRIYDRKGRYESSVRQDEGGRMKMYDRKGRYHGYIEDGRVYGRDGTLEHRIVPDKNNKKK